MNEQDNFLMPQALPALAAVLRQDGHDVRVIDCMPEKMGWRRLEQEIRDFDPAVVAAGENHATYASEVIRLVRTVKEIDSSVITVLGGGHFTNVDELYLRQHPIDLIVRGEGEITMQQIARTLEDGTLADARQVDGIAWWDGRQVQYTAPRALVEDLDDLPIPAYDLMPMDKYGKAKYLFSNGGTTIHHSRGCPARCSFCVWWTQDAVRKVTTDEHGCRQEVLAPKWRTKSVDRMMAEIELLYEKYDKKCLIFTDPTFNVDPNWCSDFADALMARGYDDLTYMAFVRADFILRDHENGVLRKLVDSGLSHTCIGVERIEDDALGEWRKKFYSNDRTQKTFRILRDEYPKIFRQATFIVGDRKETPESMRRQLEFARTLKPDYPAFHPLTPFPGTAVYDEAVEKGWLEITDFDYFDLATPVMRSESMSREQIETEIYRLNRSFVSIPWLLKGLFSRSKYRRNMYIWWLRISLKIFLSSLAKGLNPFRGTRYTRLVEPDWYA